MIIIDKIKADLIEFKSFIEQDDVTALEVSKWSVYAHIEHLLIANSRILDLILNKEDPSIKGISLLGRLVLTLGVIPRGKGKAPEYTEPKGLVQSDLLNLHNSVVSSFAKIENQTSKFCLGVVAKHPYFGGLTPRQWLKFAAIHQRHHLKIVREIKNYK